MTVPNEETLRRTERDVRFVQWLLPRLRGDGDDVETVLVMLYAVLKEKYADGVHDSAWVLRELHRDNPSSRHLEVASEALDELECRTRADAAASPAHL